MTDSHKNSLHDQALTDAAMAGDLKAVERALEAGADINALRNNWLGNTALYLACREKHWDVAKYLVWRGASILPRDVGGGTALNQAFGKLTDKWDACAETAIAIIDAGVERNDFRNGLGWPALHIALIRKNHKLADALLARKWDIDVRDRYGCTTLMTMTQQPHDTMDEVRYLLAKGADMTLRNDSGQTALDMAHERYNNSWEDGDAKMLGRLIDVLSEHAARLKRAEVTAIADILSSPPHPSKRSALKPPKGK